MKRQPFGRWNRESPCNLDVVSSGNGCWAECTNHGFQGTVRGSTAEADADAEGHEREMFDRHKAGQRFVRGRFE